MGFITIGFTYLPPVPVMSSWHLGWLGLVYRNEQQTAFLFRGNPAWGSRTATKAPRHYSDDRQTGKLLILWPPPEHLHLPLRSESKPHLNGGSWQDDAEVGSQLFDGFGEFGFPILDHMALIEDTVIKFYISGKIRKNRYFKMQHLPQKQNKTKQTTFRVALT